MRIRITLLFVSLLLILALFVIDKSFWSSLNEKKVLSIKNPCFSHKEQRGCSVEELVLNTPASESIFLKLSEGSSFDTLISIEEEENLELTEGLNQTLNGMNSVVQRKDDLIALVSSIDTQTDPLSKKLDVNLVKEAREELFSLVSESSQERLSVKKMVIQAQSSKSIKVKKIAKAMLEDIKQKKIDVLQTTKSYVLIKVKQGDTLVGLANRYYGDSKLYKKIYNVNRERVGKKMQIYANSIIMIPKGEI